MTAMTGERCAKPGEDDFQIQKLEVEFAIPVFVTPEQMRRLDTVVSDIVSAPENQPTDGVHWLAGGGHKPKFSQTDARFLGKPVDPNAPESGEPEWDDSILYLESAARGFVSEKERERVLTRRAKPAGSVPGDAGTTDSKTGIMP